MDWSLYIFIGVILFFTWRGYKNGLAKSLARILSLAAGYVAAILFSGKLSTVLESTTPLEGVIAFIAASMMLFIGAGIVINLLLWLITKLFPAGDRPSLFSSMGGAVVGASFGFVAALLIVWSFAFVRDMRPQQALDTASVSPHSGVERFASQVASKTLSSALSLGSASPEVSSLSSAMIAAPAEMAQRAQRLAASNDLTAILNDPQGQAILNHADVDALQKLPAFQQLARNPDLLALADSAGMLEPSGVDGQAMDAVLAQQMVKIWGQAQQVKNDPRVQEILANPEFQQKIQSGNPIDLLTNSDLLELADIIFAEDAQAQGAGQSSGNTAQPVATKKQIYSWTDSKGRIHYSDVEPAE